MRFDLYLEPFRLKGVWVRLVYHGSVGAYSPLLSCLACVPDWMGLMVVVPSLCFLSLTCPADLWLLVLSC